MWENIDNYYKKHMSSKFITNQDKLLSDVMNNIIPNSKNLYFLVGYFYFSGFFELYEQLKNKKIKILIGLEIEKELGNRIQEINVIEDQLNNKRRSNKEIRDKYYKSLVDLVNNTNFCDTPEKEEAFKLFLIKIKDGSLEIRKTKESNHAKLYIFENKEEYSQGNEFPGTIITGSSNLTISGLKNRFEVNVISREKDDYETCTTLFNELWEKSIVIVNKDNIEDFVVEVEKKIWVDKLPSPYLIYIKVLYELFHIPDEDIKFPSEITKENYFDLEYQKDAIKIGINIIRKHNGVIVADVVGLGKSIIASAIASNLGLQTIIICPPHLKEQWDDYRRMFNFSSEVYTSGSIQKALENYENVEHQKLIIVDEAHKYRNELTGDYKHLSELCAGNKVLLLTATPFNNKPQDIFAMIKLFQIPAKSTIRTVDNLSNRFKELINDYKKLKDIENKDERKIEINSIASRIREILSPLVVRRSRIDLDKISRYKEDLARQGIEFSKVESPELLKYQLGELESKYVETLDKIINEKDGFIGARYKPTSYIKPDKIEKYEEQLESLFKEKSLLKVSQQNVAIFMKRLLVHRFESSSYAFKSTLNSMIHSMSCIKEWYEQINKVPIFKKGNLKDVDDIKNDSSDDDEELKSLDENLEKLKLEKGYYYIDADDLKKDFYNELQKDIKLLEDIKNSWFPNDQIIKVDPKIEKLREFLKKKLSENKDRKIVIFTSYNDTADYVYDKIKDNFRIFKYSSKDSSQENKNIIKKNFDAGLKESLQENEFDILMATDAISEGFNLHRAGIVINFDIPYNPTRVIQRVGRINRINKKVFDKLYIYNFFPTIIGERETRIKKISTLKIDMINALLGNDTRILTNEEELESFYKEQYKNEEETNNQESWETKYQKELEGIDGEVLDKANNEIYYRTKIKRCEKKDKQGVLIFAKKGNDYIFKFGDGDKSDFLGRPDALKILEADKSEKSQGVSKSFYSIYQDMKNNLFVNEEKIKIDKGDSDMYAKIIKLLELYENDIDYLEDLEYVAKDLKALPDGFAKYIRNINFKDKEIMKDLKKEISHSYLRSIIKTANDIDDGQEYLILAEELI